MDDATYYEWWDRLTGAKTLEALDAVVAELAATVDVHDPDLGRGQFVPLTSLGKEPFCEVEPLLDIGELAT